MRTLEPLVAKVIACHTARLLAFLDIRGRRTRRDAGDPTASWRRGENSFENPSKATSELDID